jgi:enediyne biosynthesis protein E4
MISITPVHLRTDIPVWCPVVIAVVFCASCAGPEDKDQDQSESQAGVSVETRLQPWPSADDLNAEELVPGIQGTPLRARSSGVGPTMFTDLPVETTGVDFVSVVEAEHPQAALYRSGLACSGLAIGDVDGDGWPDLYLAGGAGPNKLYRQVAGANGGPGGLRFEDVTARAGKIDGGDRWAGGVSMADVDGDGDLDIYVVNYDAPNELFVNQGVGANGMVSFVDQAQKLGVDLVDACQTSAFCDYDNDGDLDLYVLTNRYEDVRGYRGNDAHTVVNGRRALKPGYEKFYMLWEEGEDWGVRAYGREDYLLRNDGGTFTNVSKEAGIGGRGDGLSVTWWDANADGLMDIYVGNDMISQDKFYMNLGDGTFRNEIEERIPHSSWFSMGADFGDLNNDGQMDFLIADMSATNHFKQKTTMGVMGGPILKAANTSRPPQYMRNALYIGTGTGRFLEGAFLAGLDSTDWTWAVKISDFDNDGWQDVFVTNGTARAMNDSDYTFTAEQLRSHHEWYYLKSLPRREERNHVMRNSASGFGFADASEDWGLGKEGVSYGAATGDLDRDGDLDLVVMNVEEPVSIFRNDSAGGNRVLIQLKGSATTGAHVRISAGDVEQQRQLVLTSGFMSANEALLHFGIGDSETVDRLEVRWPGGGSQVYSNLKANHYYVITRLDEAVQPAPDSSNSDPMFVKAEFPLQKHQEREFDDFALQPLLPNKLSQLGAGTAWGDIDGDGDDDLFLGGAAGQIAELRLNQGGGQFEAQWVDALRDDKDYEDMGAVFFDADTDGDLDLYVVSGSYEFAKDAAELQDRLYINDGKGGLTKASPGVIPARVNSGSVVAAADFDRDGDLDLFVGGRVIPGEYPLSPGSALLKNDGGKFSDIASDFPGLRESGLVTSALWSDANGDGWVDLLVTHEWGPVKLFLNREGTLAEETSAAGLDARSGWWNSIAGADIDGDGDIDYAVGNQGLNSKYHASLDKPVQIFYGDYNNDGKMNLVEAEFENDVLYPIRGKSCSSNAMPHLREKFDSFRAFATASLEEIYNKEDLQEAHQFAANTLESGLLINDGGGKFLWKVLPQLAQISPVFGLAFFDADGDGVEDLYLAQNFFGPQEETGRFDGGLSVLLRGDGNGGFDPIWPRESGLSVAGDATSVTVCDIDADQRPDLLVGINDGFPVAYSNKGNAKYLVVRPVGMAAGARVSVTDEAGNLQVREVHSGGGYLSQSSSSLFFAERGSKFKTISVRWPNGAETVHDVVDDSGSAPIIVSKSQK